MRAAFALLLAATVAGCGELPLAPDLEPGGEPGPAVYTAGGAFAPVAYATQGRATYSLDDNGQAALAFSADFTVPAVPKIVVLLSNTDGLDQAVRVGDLKANSGAQRWTFRVPRGAVWRSTVLWSEELGVEVARARLASP